MTDNNYDRMIELIDMMKKGATMDEDGRYTITFRKFDCHLIDAALRAFKHVIDSKHNYGPFICGTVGDKDAQGLHDEYMICPQYGLSGFAVYKKEHDYSEPGY